MACSWCQQLLHEHTRTLETKDDPPFFFCSSCAIGLVNGIPKWEADGSFSLAHIAYSIYWVGCYLATKDAIVL